MARTMPCVGHRWRVSEAVELKRIPLQVAMIRRLVVVGDHERFKKWLDQQPTGVQRMIKPIYDDTGMAGHRVAIVQFMPDWRESRTEHECEQIIQFAEIIEENRKQMAKPFQSPSAR